MLGNNFSYCEDSFPRIAPTPTAIVPQQISGQNHSSVPEVSLIFTNNNALSNNQASKINPLLSTSKLYNSTYPLNPIGPIPPKSSVPELSIILQKNDTESVPCFTNNVDSSKINANRQIRNNSQCSLPIRTFSMFRKEFSQKLASTKVPLKKSLNEIDNVSCSIPSQSIETLVESININNSKQNDIETSLDTSETKNKSIDENNRCNKLETTNESISKPLCQCNCSKFDVITTKIDNLDNLMNTMIDKMNEMQTDFESFKLEIKSDLIQSLSEVFSKQLNLDKKKKLTQHPPQQEIKEVEKFAAISYGREIFIENNRNNTDEELYRKSPITNASRKTENLNIPRISKKQTTNVRNFKKQVIHNVLDPLPENCPLVISCDRSLAMQKLAEKYLSETYYEEVVVNRGSKANGNLERNEKDKHVNELSFASYDYLTKYNLVKKSDDNIQAKIHDGENQNHENIMFFENLEKGPKLL